jgi:hypothetical protein
MIHVVDGQVPRTQPFDRVDTPRMAHRRPHAGTLVDFAPKMPFFLTDFDRIVSGLLNTARRHPATEFRSPRAVAFPHKPRPFTEIRRRATGFVLKHTRRIAPVCRAPV